MYSYNLLSLLSIYVVEMCERCIFCGAGDDSFNHPAYVDWVSKIPCSYLVHCSHPL